MKKLKKIGRILPFDSDLIGNVMDSNPLYSKEANSGGAAKFKKEAQETISYTLAFIFAPISTNKKFDSIEEAIETLEEIKSIYQHIYTTKQLPKIK